MDLIVYRLLRLNYRARQWFGKRLTPSGLGLLGCLFICGLIGLDIKRSVSYQVFGLLLGLLVVAIASSRFTRYRFTATRRLPRFGTVGVPLQYQVLLHNHTGKRLQGLQLIETFADTFPSLQDFRRIVKAKSSRGDWLRLLTQRRWALSSAQDLPKLIAKGETEVIGEVIPLRRGLLPFREMTIACPDPLGFVNRCIAIVRPQTVLILPQRYQLPNIDLPGGRRQQAGGLAMASSVGDSQEFRALREYRPGDSPRKIHWKSWAKLGRPVIREEQTEFSVRHALILDTFQSEAYSKVLEEAVAIASSFAYTIQADGQGQESLLDVVFTGTEAHCFTAGRGLGNTERLLELLASAAPCQDRDFSSLLPVVQSRLSLLSGCICIFLTWDENRKALIEVLQAAGIPVLVLVIAGEKGLIEDPDKSCLRDRQSSLHILQADDIQTGLWAL